MDNNLQDFSLDYFSLAGKAAIITGGDAGLDEGYAVALAKASADLFNVTYGHLTMPANTAYSGGRKV